MKYMPFTSRELFARSPTIAFSLLLTTLSAIAQENPQQLARRLAQEDRARVSATMERARRQNTPLTLQLENGRVAILHSFLKECPIYLAQGNVEAAKTTRANRLWPGGGTNKSLTGAGTKLGIWEVGGVPLMSHQELSGRITSGDGVTTPTDHATHVAGTLIAKGIDPLSKGMAYDASLVAYDATSDSAEMAAAAAGGLLLSNHSYGFLAGWQRMFLLINNVATLSWTWWGSTSTAAESDYFGMYSNIDRDYDSIMFSNPNYLIVKSAGNDRLQGPGTQPVVHYWRNSSNVWNQVTGLSRDLDGTQAGVNGYDSIPMSSTAKNILTVGSIADLPNYTGINSVVGSSFSSCGPTDDGRIKPDVVGNGEELYSSWYDANQPSANNLYRQQFISGTSMACPNVAGTAALLLQQWSVSKLTLPGRPKVASKVPSMFLKGLLIHTADDGGTPGPDYRYGWGLVNAEAAAKFANHLLPNVMLPVNWTASNGRLFGSLKPNKIDTLTLPCATAGQPIKVTLIWLDPAGPAQTPGLLDPANVKALVNDLNLEVVDPNSGQHLPWILNHTAPTLPATNGLNSVDNVEQVVISSGLSSGVYQVRVSHAGSLQGNKAQPYCVLWTNLKSGGNIKAVIKP